MFTLKFALDYTVTVGYIAGISAACATGAAPAAVGLGIGLAKHGEGMVKSA